MGNDFEDESSSEPSRIRSLSETLKLYFSPKSSQNIWPTALPVTGCISYFAFAQHVFHPRGLARLFPGSHLPIANCLLINSHLGAGLFLYQRPHIRALPPVPRVAFSAYGAVLWNFGSILLWALCKPILAGNDTPGLVRSLVACATAAGLVFVGREYLNYVDSLV